LDGSLNDVASVRQLLITRFGFQDGDVHVLTEAQASREGIRTAIHKYLADPAAPGDVSFFFYAGHGSQMANSKSPESDKLDETIVPADALAGALDIRDKELARDFMAVLQKGAVLTAIFDSCHSGSIARAFSRWQVPRDVAPDLSHDAADDYSGPFPEKEGALIISAAQDIEAALEGKDDQGVEHGAFTSALTRVLTAASPTEPANSIFRRTLAVMRGMDANQVPVISGTPQRLEQGLFGAGSASVSGKLTLPMSKLLPDGKVEVLGGLALGLGIGSQIVANNTPRGELPVRVEIVDQTLTTSTGRILEGQSRRLKVPTLFTVEKWVPSDNHTLRLWVPPATLSQGEIRNVAGQIARVQSSGAARIAADPSETALTHFILWSGQGWIVRDLQTGESTDMGKLFRLSDWVSTQLAHGIIFVSLPLPTECKKLANELTARSFPIRLVQEMPEADYALIGRSGEDGLYYAWLRPGSVRAVLATKRGPENRGISAGDRTPSSLPTRTRWIRTDVAFSSLATLTQDLETLAGKLSRVNCWLRLDSPPRDSNFPYHLLLTEQDRPEAAEGPQIAIGDGRWYGLALRANPADLRHEVDRKKVYVFVIDSDGNGIPLYPTVEMGDVENVFPSFADIDSGQLPVTKQLGPQKLFQIAPPYGTDTYILLTVSPKDSIDLQTLKWTGVEQVQRRGAGGILDALFASIATRSPRPATPTSWSLERTAVISQPESERKP
jgi:hypothetical protein